MRKRPLWFLPITAALASVTCAPEGDLPPTGRGGAPAEATPVQPRPAEPVPAHLKGRIDAALDHVRSRDLLTTHSFWTIFHGILGLGPDATLLDPATNERVRAIDHICKGAQVRGLEFIPRADGVDVLTMAGSGIGQGHQDQFIAEMAQWGMPPHWKFAVGGKEYTFGDFLQHSKARASVTGKQELSWAVLIIGQYFGTDHRWTNAAGEELTLEDVVRYELRQPVETAACGGTHRLFGLTWVYHLHLARGGTKTGVWQEVADHIDHYKKVARKLRNADGSFSTDYLSKPGDAPDVQRRINTTGHILEWLALAMTDEELREPWVQEAANALVLMILQNRSNAIDGGSLYHATHGLYIYRTRVFGTPPPTGLLIPLPPPEKR
jgi:hypothetical protein